MLLVSLIDLSFFSATHLMLTWAAVFWILQSLLMLVYLLQLLAMLVLALFVAGAPIIVVNSVTVILSKLALHQVRFVCKDLPKVTSNFSLELCCVDSV